MKDLGEIKKILKMEITRDRGLDELWLFSKNYFLKVLKWFNMAEAKSVMTSLAGHFKLSFKQYPQSSEEKKEMS